MAEFVSTALSFRIESRSAQFFPQAIAIAYWKNQRDRAS
jgi:hypothetical protein